MKVLADAAIPNAREVFSSYGEVVTCPGRSLDSEMLKDAEVLIIRSVTRVDEVLLSKAPCLRFVGTATAGCDHVDPAALDLRSIAFASAPGCNCDSVGDYVLSVLLTYCLRYGKNPSELSLGLIGLGHTGTAVARRAAALGFEIVRNDPPRQRAGDVNCNAGLEQALRCDIVSLHVPLTREGEDATWHLLNEETLSSLKDGAFLINASRGSVVDNEALLKVLKIGRIRAWCDVFEGEPEIKVKELLPCLEGATAHIAGYSYESKRRSTVMLARSMSQTLELPPPPHYTMPEPEITHLQLGELKTWDLDLLRRLVFCVYDVNRDAAAFKLNFKDGRSFDELRRTYRERRELSSLKINTTNAQLAELLKALSFGISAA
ncbi:MAG: 4-phosphoerythronate dehydrogenase [Succinivibrio sp.]|nr:4-phosphoerythronate dehydrogenase [Succinivibrio sp.]